MENLSIAALAQVELRKRLSRTQALTPAQRLERYVALQAAAESLLASNPAAWERFHRRNRQQRTEQQCRELEARLLSLSTKAPSA